MKTVIRFLVVVLIVMLPAVSRPLGSFPSEITLDGGNTVSGNRYYPVYLGMYWKWNTSIPEIGVNNAVVEETVERETPDGFVSEKVGIIDGEIVSREQKSYSIINGAVFISEHVITPVGSDSLVLRYDPPCLLMPANPWVRRNWMCKMSRDTSSSPITIIEEFNVLVFEEVTVPSGSYSNCAMVSHIVTSIKDGKQSGIDSREWYCPGVGLVKMEEDGVEKLALEVSKDVKVAGKPEKRAVADKTPAERVPPVKVPAKTGTDEPAAAPGKLEVSGYTLTLPGKGGAGAFKVGVVGWSGDEKYIAFMERAPVEKGVQERAGFYIVEAVSGRVFLRYERFICADESAACSPGDIRLNGGDDELRRLLMHENRDSLEKFAIGSNPGYIFAQPVQPGLRAEDRVENVAMVLSPSRKNTYTMIVTPEGGSRPDARVASGNALPAVETGRKTAPAEKQGKPAAEEIIAAAQPEKTEKAAGMTAAPAADKPAGGDDKNRDPAAPLNEAAEVLKKTEEKKPVEKKSVEAPEPEKELVETVGAGLPDFPAVSVSGLPVDECPAGMVYVKPGKYSIGCGGGACGGGSSFSRAVNIKKGYCIDESEVTEIRFSGSAGKDAVFDSRCGADCPVDTVTWDDASAFCAVRGKRLPAEIEWVAAAESGSIATGYSATLFSAEKGNPGDWRSYEQIVGTDESGGLFGMGAYGNPVRAWEWMDDCFTEQAGAAGITKTSGDVCTFKTVEGGEIMPGGRFYTMPGERNKKNRISRAAYTGFRCAWDPGTGFPPLHTKLCPQGTALVEPGVFSMGCSAGDGECLADEKPLHVVSISKTFCMDETEVTQGNYEKIMGENPSAMKSCGGDCPVEQVSWNQAVEYCGKLGRRLPTEAEWEYAARAGGDTSFYWGGDPGPADEYAWFWKNSKNSIHGTGQKKANRYGLRDMSGNVWEWVRDCYDKGWYSNNAAVDPVNDKGNCTGRVIRGGSWVNGSPANVRVSIRSGNEPGKGSKFVGFRCVADVTAPGGKAAPPAEPVLLAKAAPDATAPAPAKKAVAEKKPEPDRKPVTPDAKVPPKKEQHVAKTQPEKKAVPVSEKIVKKKAPENKEPEKKEKSEFDARKETAANPAKPAVIEKPVAVAKTSEKTAEKVKGETPKPAEAAPAPAKKEVVSAGQPPAPEPVKEVKKKEAEKEIVSAAPPATAGPVKKVKKSAVETASAGPQNPAPAKKEPVDVKKETAVVSAANPEAGESGNTKVAEKQQSKNEKKDAAAPAAKVLAPATPEKKEMSSKDISSDAAAEAALSADVPPSDDAVFNKISHAKIAADHLLTFSDKVEEKAENEKPVKTFRLVKTVVSIDEKGTVTVNLSADEGVKAGMTVGVYENKHWMADVKIQDAGSIVSKGVIISSDSGMNLSDRLLVGNIVAIPSE